VVSRAAGFHDDQGHIAIDEPAFKLGAGEAVGFDDSPGRIGHGQLEDGLCQINGNGCSIHVGLLLLMNLISTPMKTRAPIWRKQTGESIPSFDTVPKQQEAASPLVLVGRSFLR